MHSLLLCNKFSILAALWQVLKCKINIFTLHANSHSSIHYVSFTDLLILDLSIFLRLGPGPISQAIFHCPWNHIYSNLGLLLFSHEVDNLIHHVKFWTLGEFPFMTVFQSHPWVGTSIARVHLSFHPYTKLVQAWAVLSLFFVDQLIISYLLHLTMGMNLGRGTGGTVVDDLGVWTTCSCSLHVTSGPASAWFWMYCLQIIMEWSWPCLTLRLGWSERTQVMMGSFGYMYTFQNISSGEMLGCEVLGCGRDTAPDHKLH